MRTTNQLIILSAELSSESMESNALRSSILERTIDDLKIPYKKSLGVYKGSHEVSFVVNVGTDRTVLDVLKRMAFKSFGQESVLIQDANGLSFLEFHNGKTLELGKMVEVSEDEAMRLDNYTVMDGQFFATK